MLTATPFALEGGMYLLVGLGNPGSRYARNRHNLGFMVLDEILRRYRFGTARARFRGTVFEGRIAGQRVLALKPKTYMNESGRSVGSALRFYKLKPRQVIVLHDELDLAPGKVKVKLGGGHAGHNGLRSIDAHIGRDYLRLRIGVGRPASGRHGERYLLSDFAKDDAVWLDKTIAAIGEALPLLIEGDASKFMTRFALLTNPPKHKPAPGAQPGRDEDTR
jgi:peptidyl-tRNA hydrolase, PTH1 family